MKKKTKKVSKKVVDEPRSIMWNVWIEGNSKKKGYFEGREIIEERCGETSGSGTGFGGWDCS